MNVICSACDGEKRILCDCNFAEVNGDSGCDDCDGTGYVDCDECDGSGLDLTNESTT